MIELVLCWSWCLCALPLSVEFQCFARHRHIRRANMKIWCDVLNTRFGLIWVTYTYRKVKFIMSLEFAHAHQMTKNNSQPKHKLKKKTHWRGEMFAHRNLHEFPTRRINNSRTITNTIVVASAMWCLSCMRVRESLPNKRSSLEWIVQVWFASGIRQAESHKNR